MEGQGSLQSRFQFAARRFHRVRELVQTEHSSNSPCYIASHFVSALAGAVGRFGHFLPKPVRPIRTGQLATMQTGPEALRPKVAYPLTC